MLFSLFSLKCWLVLYGMANVRAIQFEFQIGGNTDTLPTAQNKYMNSYVIVKLNEYFV